MNFTSPSSRSPLGSSVFRASVSAILLAVASTTAFSQNPPGGGDADRKRRSTGDDNGGRRGNFDPADMQARLLTSLRERLEVTDDEEWKLISERITKVNELRRNTGGGGAMGFAGRGPQPGGNGNRGSDRGGGDRGGTQGGPRGGSTEMSALQSAIRDKLPDAEIKSRLDRVRETRKDNEGKITKAQEELRALLTIRQEAVAVMFGLLP